MALFLTEDETIHVFGSGLLVESRVPDIILTLCGYSCTGRSCYSSNPGCKLETIFPEIPFDRWNQLLGLMDD